MKFGKYYTNSIILVMLTRKKKQASFNTGERLSYLSIIETYLELLSR